MGPIQHKKPRQTNIEILRITAMFLIIVSHYIYNGIRQNPLFCNFDINSFNDAANYASLQFISLFASTGVNCFVLITGYFLIDSTKIRGGIFKIWFQVAFYSLAITLIISQLYDKHVSLFEYIDCISPIPTTKYWFVAKYIGLVLISPFLAKLAMHLNAKQHLYMLIIMLVMFYKYPFGETFATGMSLCWFIFLFFTGGYIKKYGIHPWITKHAVLLTFIAAVCFFCVHASTNMLNHIRTGAEFTIKSTANNDLTFILSLLIFICFTQVKCESKGLHRLSKLAPYTFGIYLCHEHPMIRPVIWGNVMPDSFNYPILVHCLLVSAALFIVCAGIDYVREQIFRISGINKLERMLAEKLPQPFAGNTKQ